MSVAFKNWHTLALAAVLYAVNVYLLSIGNSMISTSSQSIGGWVVLVVSGYLFNRRYLLGVLDPHGEQHTLRKLPRSH